MLTRHLGVRLGGDDVDVVTVEVSLRLESGLLSTRRTGNTLPMTATDDDASSRPVGPRSVYVSVNLLGILKSSPLTHSLRRPSTFRPFGSFVRKPLLEAQEKEKAEARSKERRSKKTRPLGGWPLAATLAAIAVWPARITIRARVVGRREAESQSIQGPLAQIQALV